MPKVSGSRIEMVASGPMPGSTPTMLPTSTPTKHQNRLCRSSATVKPYQRSLRACPIISETPLQDRHRDLQQVGEQRDAENRHAGRQDRGALGRHLAVAERGD